MCVSKEKKHILNCLESACMSDMVTTDYNSSCLHVLPMNQINLRKLTAYLEKWSGKYQRLVAFRPTGWTFSERSSRLAEIKPSLAGGVSLYAIPYSEHSSFMELSHAVKGWRPSKVIPTVNLGSRHKIAEMQRMFSSWLKTEGSRTRPSLVQSKLV